jgi:hypothetical protein
MIDRSKGETAAGTVDLKPVTSAGEPNPWGGAEAGEVMTGRLSGGH